MILQARMRDVAPFNAVLVVGFAAFALSRIPHDDRLLAAFVFAPVLLYLLDPRKRSASAANQLALEGTHVVASYALRGDERIPLARIAAVEIHREGTFGLRNETTYLTIYRSDDTAIVQLAAPTNAADAFLERLAADARSRGLAWLAGAHVALAMIAVFALRLVVARRRFASLARAIATGSAIDGLDDWRDRLVGSTS